MSEKNIIDEQDNQSTQENEIKYTERKIIEFTKGQDYRVNYNKAINDDDIFYNEYIKAFNVLNNIITSHEKARVDERNYNNKNSIEDTKNIIGFTGERGQGKTTAMMRFRAMLDNFDSKNSEDISKNIVDDMHSNSDVEYKLNDKKFCCLDVLDPSKFEDFNSILDIVVIKIYNDIKNIKNQKDSRYNNNDDLRKALDKAYKSICLFKNPKQCLSKQYDLDFGITKLAVLSENMNVRENISKLVDEYLKYKYGTSENKYLVISIDDLDLDTKRSYEISEEIRKYLDCQNIIVIMAVRTKQLMYSVEREFLEDYKEMINKNIMNESEIHKMAYKYVNKLLPEKNRIILPKVNSKFDIGNLEIVYRFKDKDEKGRYKEISSNMESFILKQIYDKTGMIFYEKSGAHPIISDTLRELISLLSFVTELPYHNDNPRIRMENIELFEDYFFNHWINDNLNNYESELLNKIRCSKDDEFNYDILDDIFNATEEKSSNNDDKKSLGDLYEKLIDINNIKSVNSKITNETNILIALKIIITIRLNKIDCGCESNTDYYLESMKNLIGKKLISSNIDRNIMSYNGIINESRFYFMLDYEEYIKDQGKNEQCETLENVILSKSEDIFNKSIKNKNIYGKYENISLDNLIIAAFCDNYFSIFDDDLKLDRKKIEKFSFKSMTDNEYNQIMKFKNRSFSCEQEQNYLCKLYNDEIVEYMDSKYDLMKFSCFIKKVVLNIDIMMYILKHQRYNKPNTLKSFAQNMQRKIYDAIENQKIENGKNTVFEYNIFSFHDIMLKYQVSSNIENFTCNKYKTYEELKRECKELGYVSYQKISSNGLREKRLAQLILQLVYILRTYTNYNLYSNMIEIMYYPIFNGEKIEKSPVKVSFRLDHKLRDIFNKIMNKGEDILKKNKIDSENEISINYINSEINILISKLEYFENQNFEYLVELAKMYSKHIWVIKKNDLAKPDLGKHNKLLNFLELFLENVKDEYFDKKVCISLFNELEAIYNEKENDNSVEFLTDFRKFDVHEQSLDIRSMISLFKDLNLSDEVILDFLRNAYTYCKYSSDEILVLKKEMESLDNQKNINEVENDSIEKVSENNNEKDFKEKIEKFIKRSSKYFQNIFNLSDNEFLKYKNKYFKKHIIYTTINENSSKNEIFGRLNYILYLIEKQDENFDSGNIFFGQITKLYKEIDKEIIAGPQGTIKISLAKKIENLVKEVKNHYNID